VAIVHQPGQDASSFTETVSWRALPRPRAEERPHVGRPIG